MTTTNQPADRSDIAVDAGLGVMFAAGLAVTAYALADSWGRSYWLFGCVAGAVVCVLALARRLQRAWTAVVGLAIASAAIVVAWAADLPAEPSPTMALALSVLVGSAVGRLPGEWAGYIAAAGLAVVGGVWLTDGFTLVALFNTAGWLAAVVTGLVLRLRTSAIS